LDKNKRPNYVLVNFAHIKTLITTYVRVVLFLNREDKEIREALSRELEIVIGVDDIKLLWKLYICSQGLAARYNDLQRYYDVIEENNKKMLSTESLSVWFEEVKLLLNIKHEEMDASIRNQEINTILNSLYHELKD
jgi:hypothetical protein